MCSCPPPFKGRKDDVQQDKWNRCRLFWADGLALEKSLLTSPLHKPPSRPSIIIPVPKMPSPDTLNDCSSHTVPVIMKCFKRLDLKHIQPINKENPAALALPETVEKEQA